MKSDPKLSKDKPAGLKKVIQILESIHESAAVYSAKGDEIYSGSKSVFPAGFKKLLKDKDIQRSITEAGFRKDIAGKNGIIRINFTAVEFGREKFIICTADCVDAPRKTGFIWDTFNFNGDILYSGLIEQISGYTSNELNKLPGKTFALLDQNTTSSIKDKLLNFIQSKELYLELLYSISSKDGGFVWLRETITVRRNSAGKIISHECSLVELSSFQREKKALEGKVEELQKQNRNKEQFISILSHDLKSPYTSILGFAEILLSENSLSDEERNEYLSYIYNSSRSQLNLIDNLLEWSRLVTGRKQIEETRINLKYIIERIISDNTRCLHDKELEIVVDADKYIYAEADEKLLSVVLNILISNAVKYSHPGRKIEVYTKYFNEDQVEVIVKDEGTGISEKNKARLLKIDSVFSKPGTAGERGTGISLILANEIVKSHKGELWYYSEEGKGSEFHFTMPAEGTSILLISSNETEKLKTSSMLKSNFPGFRLIKENDYYNAIKILNELKPSLVIAEHELPLMNGLEFLKIFRQEQRYAGTPVIVCSGKISSEIEEGYRRLGVSDILSIPVNLQSLKEKIELNLK